MSTAADRAALIARQGAGARYDAAQAPADDLLLARRGTAYFARVLNGLSDAALVMPARAALVGEVGYHARFLAEHLAALRMNGPRPGAHGSRETASLPARALRSLFQHSAIHLDVEWRDLPGPLWQSEVPGLEQRAQDTPAARAAHIWHAALRLGGREHDLPRRFR